MKIKPPEEVKDNTLSPMPLVLKDDDGIRPAGRPNQCFYCNQQVGKPHKQDCACLVTKERTRDGKSLR